MHASKWVRPAVVVLMLAAMGCAEKLTYQRWETIHDGASSDVVRATLGDPWQKTDMAWVYNDSDRHITAFVYFEGDKVIGKTWEDPEHGMQGKSPNVNQPGDAEEIKVQTIK